MKHILILSAIALLMASQAMSQTPDGVIFETISHDFGSFSEDGDNRTCHFRFTNRSKGMIAVAHVQTTCGCATADYPRQPVASGKSGVISITYNPKGRPGRFSRSILVSFAGMDEKVKLHITGTVIPGAVRKDKRFPYVMGDLQLKTASLRFQPMRGGDEEERSIRVVNSGKAPLRIALHSADSSLSGRAEPAVLLPDSVGEIKISRKADAGKDRMKCIRHLQQPVVAGSVGIRYGLTQYTIYYKSGIQIKRLLGKSGIYISPSTTVMSAGPATSSPMAREVITRVSISMQ